MTFRHRAGVSPYTSSYDLAETCGFVNQSSEPVYCDLPTLQMKIFHVKRHPFFRSYGVNLPSSLTRILPFALVYSTRLPVSVCGTIIQQSMLRGFSWQQGSTTSASWARNRASAQSADFPTDVNAYTLTPESNHRLAYLAASPHRSC